MLAAPGLCLIAPPLSFFSAVNEASAIAHHCSLLTLFGPDFPPGPRPLFDLICLELSS